MNYRKLGKWGLKISEIALGGWLTAGGYVDKSTVKECVKAAFDNGINFFDLADVYARGKAEEVYGEIINELGLKRTDLVISSKVFWPMSENINDKGLSRKHIFESIDKSLKRLKTDYVDIYFCHRYDPETPVEEVVMAMEDLVRMGKVLYWGTSMWSASQIEDATGFARFYKSYPPVVEQPRYNMLHREIEIEKISLAKKNGMGLVVWSPLAQGLLTGKYNNGIPEGSRAAISKWLERDLTEENIEKVKKLTIIAEELGITMSQLALAWILRLPEITCAITGASKKEHVITNVKASEVKLDQEVLNKIEEILNNKPDNYI